MLFRSNVRIPGGFETRLVRFAEPLLRLPNLAIHMNREVNENGLKFNKQTELPLLLGVSEDGSKAEARFRQPIAALLGVEPDALLTWELNAYDTQKGAFWGVDGEFIAKVKETVATHKYCIVVCGEGVIFQGDTVIHNHTSSPVKLKAGTHEGTMSVGG